MAEEWKISTKTISGIPVSIDPRRVIAGGISFDFANELEFQIKDIFVSISSHFIALISNEKNGDNYLYLITLTTPGTMYIDLLDISQQYRFACFSCDETKLIALTNHNTIHYYRTLPPNFIQEFVVDVPTPAVSFQLVEANGVLQVTCEDDSRHCFFLPESLSPPVPGSTTVLRPAGDAFMSLFSPIEAGEINETENQEIDDEDEFQGDKMEFNDRPQNQLQLSQVILDKTRELKEKEEQLVARRNHLQEEIENLRIRGNEIHNREERAKLQAQQLFARIQKLIESKNGGSSLQNQREEFNRAENQFLDISIQELPVDEDTIYKFRTSNFKQRLARIRAELEHNNV